MVAAVGPDGLRGGRVCGTSETKAAASQPHLLLASKSRSPMTTRAPAVIERLPVKTLAAEKRDLEITLPVFGTITYLDKVEVASEVQGVLKAVPGSRGPGQKGQVLAILDTELLHKELQSRTAMEAQAQAQLKNAAWQYEAQEKLHRVGGSTLSDLEKAEADYRSLQGEVQRYAAEAAQIRTQIKKSTIRAPMGGVVASRNFNEGEKVPILGRQEDKGIVTLMRLEQRLCPGGGQRAGLGELKAGIDGHRDSRCLSR